MSNRKTIIATVFATLFAFNANAGIVTNDTELLTASGHEQLTQWLGEDVDLTRIFAKDETNSTGKQWHDAVDEKGRTFVVMETFANGQRMVLGGYNDAYWDSSYSSYYNEDSTNFLFNLSTGEKYQFTHKGGPASGETPNDGSKFGSADLYVYSKLSSGTSYIGRVYTKEGYSGYEEDFSQEFTGSENHRFEIGKFETFTLSVSTGGFGDGATASISEKSGLSDVPIAFSISSLFLLGLASRKKR